MAIANNRAALKEPLQQATENRKQDFQNPVADLAGQRQQHNFYEQHHEFKEARRGGTRTACPWGWVCDTIALNSGVCLPGACGLGCDYVSSMGACRCDSGYAKLPGKAIPYGYNKAVVESAGRTAWQTTP